MGPHASAARALAHDEAALLAHDGSVRAPVLVRVVPLVCGEPLVALPVQEVRLCLVPTLLRTLNVLGIRVHVPPLRRLWLLAETTPLQHGLQLQWRRCLCQRPLDDGDDLSLLVCVAESDGVLGRHPEACLPGEVICVLNEHAPLRPHGLLEVTCGAHHLAQLPPRGLALVPEEDLAYRVALVREVEEEVLLFGEAWEDGLHLPRVHLVVRLEALGLGPDEHHAVAVESAGANPQGCRGT
mmetsp:Transcript_15984/g.48181  ORF Transcript_15984/g.48181 Transcript_15984/m.48181 type:complete len:240 (+) Transcript_15984:65-784(+)